MKTAWIFPGGAARSVYTAGAIYALSKIKPKDPDLIIAASGSAPTSVCYLTGQYEIIPKVWLGCLSTRRFVNFLRFWKIVDVDYLIDDVVRRQNGLKVENAKNSSIEALFPLTDADTGCIEYFSNKSDVALWDVLKSAVSVPICTNLFSIKGNKVGEKYYSDSTPASRFELHVKKAIELGANKIFVFDGWHPDDNPGSYFFSKLLAWVIGWEYRDNQLRYIEEIRKFSPPAGVEFIKISPSKKLGMGRFEIDNKMALGVFNRGFEDILARRELFN